MRLTFLGHAAFLIETAGKRILTDPYSSEIGYRPISERADIVTLSHDNLKWHSCLDDVMGDFEVVRGLEILENPIQKGEIELGAVQVFETAQGDGSNAMIWLQNEGIRVLHTGDCGILPDDEIIGKCGRVDVLLALAGGFPTLSLDDLMVLIEKLRPKIVIPMHFGVPGLKMEALGFEEIEKRFAQRQIVHFDGSTAEISRENWLTETQLWILRPQRIQNA